MSVDGMAVRARRLAELEANQVSREQQARSEWSALRERARALGQPVPEAVAGRLSTVLSTRAEALDNREAALSTLERTLADWRAGLDRVEDEDRALARLRERLHEALADEVGELSPGELSRVVARAFGDRRNTGPLGPPPEGAPPPAGVQQEALLLDHLVADDSGDDPPARSAHFEAAFGSGNGPLDTLNQGPPDTAGTRNVEAARIEEFDTAGSVEALRAAGARRVEPPGMPSSPDPFAPFADAQGDAPEDALVTIPGLEAPDIGALLPDPIAAVRRPRSLMRQPTDDLAPSVELEIDVDDADLEPSDETLARWLGTQAAPPGEPEEPHTADRVDASIEPLDGVDSLLEWEAEGLGNDVAKLVERRRPASARTSVNEIARDPFDAFDDFDDSLDAPFGFVENVTGQGPALAGADWSMNEGGQPDGKPARETFEELLLEDPFADGSSAVDPSPDGTDPIGRSSGSADRVPVDTAEIDRVDLREAFPTIGAPLGADSMEDPDPPLHLEAAFEDALGEVFAQSGPDAEHDSLDLDGFDAGEPGADDSLDLEAFEAEVDAALAEDEPPAPEAPPAPAGPMTVSSRPTARPWTPAAVDGPQGGSLLPAPSDPGADGWGPRRLDDQPAPETASLEPAGDAPEAEPDDEDASSEPDHIVTDFGAALVGPGFGAPTVNPFATPQVTMPAPAPPMHGAEGSSERPAAIPVMAVGAPLPTEVLAEALAEGPSASAGPGEGHLTGLDWPPPRALHAFPDGSMDGSVERLRLGGRPTSPGDSAPSGGTWDGLDSDLLSAALSDALDGVIEPEAPAAPASPVTQTAAYPAVGAAPAEPSADAPADSDFDPTAFARGFTRPGLPHDAWRSTPVAPSASLADALEAARLEGSGELDAVLDVLEAPDEAGDEQRRLTDRFAALAGDLGDDPWVSLDIARDATGPDSLPALMRQRRQGRASEPVTRLPGGDGRRAPAAPVEVEEESAPRAPLGVRVGLEAGDRFFTGFSRDISVDGLFVKTQHALEVGEAVEVFFELPGGRSINAVGTVQRVRRGDGGRISGLGLRFRQLTREARVHIGRYVARTLTGKIPLP